MALSKSKELASGVSGVYWKIMRVQLDCPGNSVFVQVCLYKDSDAKVAGKLPMSQLEYTWSGDDNPCTIAAMDVVSSNPIKLCYAKLKTLDEFSGAQDI